VAGHQIFRPRSRRRAIINANAHAHARRFYRTSRVDVGSARHAYSHSPSSPPSDSLPAEPSELDALMLGGLLGLAGAAADRRLAPRESVVAAAGSAACFGVGVLALRVPVPLMKPARLAPRIASGGCYLAALLSTAGAVGIAHPHTFPQSS
jgi:hypothetical protein